MAIEFTSASNQGVAFQSVAAARNLVNKTVSCWFNLDATGAGDTFIENYGNLNGWWIDENAGAGTIGKLRYIHLFSGGTSGYWYINAAPSTGTWHHLAITYNNSATANVPGFYLDGGTVASTTDVVPSGTAKTEDGNFYVGRSLADGFTIDGKLQDVRIYNRILSASEIELLAKGRCQMSVQGGLVFWAPLNGAQGLRQFEGATIGATNYLREMTTGALGTAVGSPLGAGNTIQRIK